MPRPWYCGRCGGLIEEGEAWDAGHLRDVALGTDGAVRHEHRSCNRRAGAQLGTALKRAEIEKTAQARIRETAALIDAGRRFSP